MNRLPPWLPWAVVLMLAAWSSYGVWPVAPVEGDEQGVLFGVAGMVGSDQLLLQMRYTYELQPGYYWLLVNLVRLTGASPETWFAITTVLGAIGFAFAGARLLQILLAWPLGWALVAMLWCQEVTTAACYMNTSTLGGAVAISAVLVSVRPGRASWLWSGLLLAVAGWLRADSLLVAPACLGLGYWREKQWWAAMIKTAAIAAVAVAVLLGLYTLSGTSVLDSLTAYEQRGFLHSGWRTFVDTFPQLLSPALALAGLAGLGLLLAPRHRALGVVFAAGVAASLLAHGTELTTPKYFYHMIPFLLIPALVLAGELMRVGPTWRPGARRAAGGALLAVLLADNLLGLRTLTAAQRFFVPTPTLATLLETKWKDKPLALVIGPGELILNVDAFRLRTGKIFAPLSWHREKQRVRADLATIRSWLADGPRELTLYWANWLPVQMAKRELLALGFRPPERHSSDKGAPPLEDWHRADRTVHLAYLGYAGSAFQPSGPAPASTTGAATYFIGDEANHPLTELADARYWHLLSATTEGLTTLYQRR